VHDLPTTSYVAELLHLLAEGVEDRPLRPPRAKRWRKVHSAHVSGIFKAASSRQKRWKLSRSGTWCSHCSPDKLHSPGRNTMRTSTSMAYGGRPPSLRSGRGQAACKAQANGEKSISKDTNHKKNGASDRQGSEHAQWLLSPVARYVLSNGRSMKHCVAAGVEITHSADDPLSQVEV
jgi:hypothetical protein